MSEVCLVVRDAEHDWTGTPVRVLLEHAKGAEPRQLDHVSPVVIDSPDCHKVCA